ncbi:MAG: hypothetical protein AB8G99_23260 [Planctomycetaceae bacterium]
MGQTIEIVHESGFLERGQTVEFPIVLNLDQPMSRVRNVTAEFYAAERAEAEYTETETDSDGDTRTVTKTAVEHHTILKESFVLHGNPSPGFFRGLMDSMATVVGGGKSGTLGSGTHEYSVAVTLPEDLPPSMEGKKCQVFYKLTVRIDRSLARDPREEKKFRVVPIAQSIEPQPVVARFPNEDGFGFWQRTFGKQAHLTLVIDRDSFVSGDNMDCMFGVETESPMKIRKMTARVLCIEKTKAHGHSDSYTHASEPITLEDKQELPNQFSKRFTMPLDAMGLPTWNGKLCNVDWYVEVTLDVPWAADPVIRAPIRVVFP